MKEHFEENASKAEIRKDLLSQIKTFCKTSEKAPRKLDLFTLPGQYCKMEQMLSSHFSDSSLQTILSIKCAEKNPAVLEYVKKNHLLPKEATIELGLLTDVLRRGNTEYDVIWLDFMCGATPVLIAQMVDYIINRLKHQGIIYITFWIKGVRCLTGSKQALIDLVKSGTIEPDPKAPKSYGKKISNEEVRDVILSEIGRKFKAKRLANMYKIYDVIYNGGRLGGTPMITLGFSKNILKRDPNYIEPIIENRIEIDRIAKKADKPKLTPKEKIYILIHNHMPDKAILTNYNLTVAQLSAHKAHFRKRGIPWKKEDRIFATETEVEELK